MANFKREPKMQTTEPSDDEVRMKKGGKTGLFTVHMFRGFLHGPQKR